MELLSYAGLFLAAALLMMLSTERLAAHGLEGTVIGTLVLPYCSGAPNLVFVAVLALHRGPPGEVLINAAVNNVTNLTVLLALPALLWGLAVVPRSTSGRKGAGRKAPRQAATGHLNRLALMLTLLAGLFFTGLVWLLARDGSLERTDGLCLVGVFLFWQLVELFAVLRANVAQGRRISPWFVLDLLLLAAGAALMYHSVERLVALVSAIPTGFVSVRHLGWLSGWLMVLPNAVPALYYAARGRADIVYSTQAGDGHICIPLCIGLAALLQPLGVPPLFLGALAVVAGLLLLHLLLVTLVGALPRPVAFLLLLGYGVLLHLGWSP